MTAEKTAGEPSAPLAPADPHPVSRYVSSLTTAVSRSTGRTSLDMAARILSDGACEAMTLPWVQIRREHVLRFRRIVAERYARVTANRMLSVVRGVLRECWRSGELSAETLQHCLDVKMIAGEDLPAGRVLSRDEIRELLALPGNRPICVRQRAMVAMYYATLCRRAELLQVERSDYDDATGTLTIRRAKGRHQGLAWVVAADFVGADRVLVVSHSPDVVALADAQVQVRAA